MRNNYDRIARFYDVDMGRNMAFDDAAFYAGLCAAHGGRSLELGCGNGRILLPLLASGLDVVGIDASEAMLAELQRKASSRGMAEAPVCRMDLRALAFGRNFDTVLCPYSIVTYLTTDADFARMLEGVQRALRPSGHLVLDVFVPRPITVQAEFQLDYRRPFGAGELQRTKRISALSPALNRIERRYELYGADGGLAETVDVIEEIRPYTQEELQLRVSAAGFAIDRVWWDYAEVPRPANPQFITLSARLRA